MEHLRTDKLLCWDLLPFSSPLYSPGGIARPAINIYPLVAVAVPVLDLSKTEVAVIVIVPVSVLPKYK